jgi:phosphoribosylanthranilate isomerase
MQVKVCCIASIAEAEMALAHGANALGLVSAMPSGPGVIADGVIADVARWARGRARTFLLTSRTDPQAIAEQVAALGPETVQLVDAVAAVGPHGLDICSGVRTQGALDPVRLAAFVAGARPTA